MIMVVISPETWAIEVRDGFNLALPKFLWTILEARAKTLHQGDLQATMMELVNEELMRWFGEASRKMAAAPVSSIN